jgi:hypothetical protein
MGVKMCSRKGCDSLMPSRYSREVGSICYSCYSELESQHPITIEEIEVFMNTEKNERKEELKVEMSELLLKKIFEEDI